MIKIFHSADVQVNVAGKHFGRYNEHEYMLSQLAEIVINGKYDVAVFIGDMFERYTANDTERLLLVNNLIRPILDANIPVLWTDGNHDLKQANFTFDPGDGSVQQEANVLKALTEYINDPRLTYAEESGFYSLGEFSGKKLIAAVWAHKSKYSVEQKPINPWYILSQQPEDKQTVTRDMLENSIVFDTYHDPVKDVKNFDGSVVRGNNDARTDISEFRGDFCLMGDIHMPSIMRSPNRPESFFATYPSSPMVLYYGEGDYYDNFTLVYDRNNLHGYNEVIVRSKTDIDCTFKPVNQYTTRHTITITDKMTVDNVHEFELVNASSIHNMVRLVLTSYENIEVLDALVKHLHNKYICTIDVKTKTAANIAQSYLDETFDISNLSDRNYLIDIANKCISDKINAGRDSDEYKEKLIEDSMSLFIKALDQTQYVVALSKYKFLEFGLTNFMPIDNLKINFEGLTGTGSIIKINGNNGTGKTTIYKGLSWVTNGKIDSRQQDNKSKQNNLAYFNDKAWNIDETSGYNKVQFNDDVVKVVRQIKRIWSPKATDVHKKSLEWRNYVNKVEEAVTVYVNDVQLPDNEAQLKIDEVFGGFDKFQSLHVINQASLDNMLLNLPLDKLIDHILKSIGFTLNEQLKQKDLQEALKTSLFEGLTKHNKDIAGINIDIGIKDTEILQVETEINTINESITNITGQINDAQLEINKLNVKLHNISDDEKTIIANGSQQLTEQINRTQTDIASVNNLINNPAWNETKAEELKQLKEKLTTLNAELLKITNDINTVNQAIGNGNLQISQIDNQINQTGQKLQFKISSEVMGVKEQQTKDMQTMTGLQTGILTAVNAASKVKNDEIDKIIADINTQITAKESSITQYQEALTKVRTVNESKQTQIDELNSGSCKICDKSYAELPTVKAEVSKYQNEITENNGKLTAIQTALSGFMTEVEKLKKSKTDHEASKFTLVTSLSEIDINALSPETAKMMIEFNQLNEAVKQEVIEAKIKVIQEQQHTPEDAELLVKYRTDRQTAVDNITKLNAVIPGYNEKATGIPKEIESVTLNISQLEAFRDSNTAESLYKRLSELNILLSADQKKLESIAGIQLKMKENEQTNYKISELEKVIADYRTSQTSANSEIAKAGIKLNTLKMQKQQYESIIDEIKAYEHANNIWKIYMHVTGVKGLNKYVFDTVALQINNELNNLLDGLNYRIFFDLADDYSLKMIDLLGNASVRDLYTIGGMESTLGALALVTVIKSKTIKNNGNFLFVDEITGKLNNSKDTKGTTETNKDYHYEFFSILKKLSENTNICIIDHSLPIEWFQTVLDIVKYDNGISELIKQ